jgi:putative ABC transport system substrate-binding protein
MRRREFITLLGVATADGPCAARAQQGERVRRIGVLSGLAVDDQDNNADASRAFQQRLQQPVPTFEGDCGKYDQCSAAWD